MKAGVEARLVAATALGRVLRGGAWSNLVLDSLATDMRPEDRAFTRRLLYGTLRRLDAIDAVLAGRIRRPLDAVEGEVLDTLRVGVYELRFGEAAAHGAVNSAVEAVKALGKGRAAGFVNGVLRNVARDGDEPLPDVASGTGFPSWLVTQLSAAWGDEAAASFIEASNTDAARTARVRPGAKVAGPPTAIPDVVELAPGPLPDGVILQDPSSAAVVHALGDVGGRRVVDLAAAPGGKTLQIADQHPNLLVAADAHTRRLERARRRLRSLGYEGPWVAADGRRAPFREKAFDLVLLDAPCSGLGTLRRRPEIRHRVSPDEVERLARLQAAMLREALRIVRPGGRVVYSVCTVTPAETVDVVAPVGGHAPSGLPGWDQGTGLLLAPHLTQSDGMFISVIEG